MGEHTDGAFASLKGKKAFITGAGRGIGRRIREEMEGAGVYVEAPGRSELDLEDRGSIRKYLEKNGEIEADIFIHCAGLNKTAGIDEINMALVDRVFQVNLFSAIELLRSTVPYMRKNGWGRVLLISSLYSIVSREGRIAYSASKNALTGLSKTLTLELAPYNILTNCLAPGYVLTDMTYRNLTTEEIRDIQGRIPTGRFQSEEEIANAAMFLCSDLNQSITGQLIAVDGGFICR